MALRDRRIAKEFSNIKKETDANISAELINDNLNQWQATIIGPIGTAYEYGILIKNRYTRILSFNSSENKIFNTGISSKYK